MGNLFETKTQTGFAHVAVERGVDRFPEGLTYSVPLELADLAVGERVIVPLGRSDTATGGYVIDRTAAADYDAGRIKAIARRDPAGPRLPGELLRLARWMAGYYCAPIGMTLATMVPASVKRGIGLVSRRVIDLGEAAAPPRITPKQKRVIEVLTAIPPQERPIEARRLADLAGLRTTGPIDRLVEQEVLVARPRSSIEAAWLRHAVETTAPQTLTDEQRVCVESIGPVLEAGFSAHLLFGVTGSGKTEVYIRLIRQVVEAGKVAILLVPEIALTPQTGGRLIGRFGDRRVAILHSGLTAAQRHQQWRLAADGTADIVLGARSAIFAPVPEGRLGLVVVDEEHDGSYKQDQVPRYQGRDVAVRRAQLARCPVVLGSATPSLESWHNARVKGVYTLHRLTQRVPGLQLPRVAIVDFAAERRKRRDRRVHLLGPILEGAIGRTLRAGGQVILLLNRRGFANYIACPDARCGWLLCCDHCDTTMVYHLHRFRAAGGGFVRCHHCLSERKLPDHCPLCEKRVAPFGLGTQRVEKELSRAFPELVEGRTMLRVDSDTMHDARSLHDALGRFGTGEVRALLGTQMIAKGLDFPNVRLVGVVNADTAINLPDFRATERTFQLVNQVAGRCGRGTTTDRVVVQTFQPETPAIKLAAAHDFEAFAAGELAERRRAGLPPWTRMARIVIRDADHDRCQRAARDLGQRLRGLMTAIGVTDRVTLLGPAPCPIARIAGKHRQQLELLSPGPGDLQTLLAEARNAGFVKAGSAMAIDVDPVALL
ncbi:MAG: replication restart helicase PriA [Planctomycetota bacterium]|jgi:primosomal protein N' (replication factor Y)